MVLSAGIVVVREEEGEWKYLFLRAYRNWDFPKGIVGEGEDPLLAAKREVEEETGIQDLRFQWGIQYKETDPYLGGKKIARYYVAVTSEKSLTLPSSPELGRPEHDEYRWISYEELKTLAPPRLQPIVEWVKKTIAGD
jgi:8-oxo-dGTP pyrophosphatase MutT (NUDIX family)